MEIKLTESQMKFMKGFDKPCQAFCAGVGSGKSFIAALWVFKRAYVNGEKGFVCSQTAGTLSGVQFQALIDLFTQFGMEEDRDYTYNRSSLEIGFPGKTGHIKGIADGMTKSAEGWTKRSFLWVDEASNIDGKMIAFLTGRCRNGTDKDGNLIESHIILTGTPPLVADPNCYYYQWLIKHPNDYVSASTKEGVGRYLLESYYEQQLEVWGGKGSPLANVMVEGMLPTADCSNSIFTCEHNPTEIQTSMGIDCSGGNNGDLTIFFITDGLKEIHREEMKNFTFKERNAKALALAEAYNVKTIQIDQAYGAELGEWLEDNTKNIAISVIPFGGKPKDDRYLNNRAEMYYNCAKKWAFGDLCYKERMATVPIISSSGRLQLVDKEQVKKILGGASPDLLDAIALALYTDSAFSKVPLPENIGNLLSSFSVWS